MPTMNDTKLFLLFLQKTKIKPLVRNFYFTQDPYYKKLGTKLLGDAKSQVLSIRINSQLTLVSISTVLDKIIKNRKSNK